MRDPLSSLDPAVRAIAERYATLAREAARLDSALSAYAARPGAACSPPKPPVAATEHYHFTEGAECSCATCVEWDMRRAELVDALSLVPDAHKWSTCACGVCRFVGRIHLNFLAATNTRDLLISMSFHATYHSPFSVQVMQWLEREMSESRYTLNWRAQEMSRVPVERWLRRCEAELGPVVSGAVFRETMHVNDAYVHFASSLAADGYLAM
jgi:hypothetical protein